MLKKLDTACRRLLDLTLALLGLLLLAPPFALIALLIKRDTPGPVFFRGARVGKGGRLFKILKFRTMYECPESYQGPRLTARGDPRVTPLGAWLRENKLNELPQLWNVLKGDMSMVGPRPEDPLFAEAWPAEARRTLLSVRPGITSPASVVYRHEETLLQSDSPSDKYLRAILPNKLRLDLRYLQNRTLLTDLDILFWTLIALIPGINRRPIPHHLLFWGPLSRFVHRHFSWFLVDLLTSLLAAAVTGLLWRWSGPLHVGLHHALILAALAALLFSLTNALFGLDRVFWSKARPSDLIDLALSSGLTTLGLDTANRQFLSSSLPPELILQSGILAFIGFAVVRYRARLITGLATRWLHYRRSAPTLGERVLIVGAGETAQITQWLIQKSGLDPALHIIGLVDDDPRKRGMRLNGCTVLGTSRDIPQIVATHDIGLILYSIANISPQDQTRILEQCRQTPAELVRIPEILRTLRDQTSPNGTPPVSHPLPPEQVLTWLGEIETLLQTGDPETTRAHIARIVTALQR